MKLLNKKTIKNIKCEEKEKSKKIEELKKVPKNLTSFDGYKKNKIKELNEITEFSSLIPLPPPTPYLTLFETKILAGFISLWMIPLCSHISRALHMSIPSLITSFPVSEFLLIYV